MDELDKELVERISTHLNRKNIRTKIDADTASAAIHEFLEAARNEGGNRGKKHVDDLLKRKLDEAKKLCDDGDFNGISRLIEDILSQQEKVDYDE